MTTRQKAPAGAPVWIELNTTDVDRARQFYARVFGWEAEEPRAEFGGYFNFLRQGVPIAGGMASQATGVNDIWAVYLASEDARKTVDLATAQGGQVVSPAMDVMDLGTMAVVQDVAGATTGVWQPGSHAGFLTTGEHGAPGWFELHTRDYDKNLAFYREVFGWQTSPMADTPEFRYSVLTIDGEQLAGVVDDSSNLPPGAPPFWRLYIWSDDADAMVNDIVAAGGTVRRPAEDTPYGRLAEVADPTGTVFSVMAANAMMPAN